MTSQVPLHGLRSMTRSVRFWAISCVLAAALGMLLPTTASASCGPCGASQCLFNSGFGTQCYGEGNSWCAPWHIEYSCQYLGGMCPTVVQGGQCGQ